MLRFSLFHAPIAGVYIYSPWTAPASVQFRVGCHIGVDYPYPIVDHAIAGALCCERLRSVMVMIHQASGFLYSSAVQSGPSKQAPNVA